MVDALYVFPRQDSLFTQIEKGWSVQGLAVSGTVLFDYNFPDSVCLAGSFWRLGGDRQLGLLIACTLLAAAEPHLPGPALAQAATTARPTYTCARRC